MGSGKPKAKVEICDLDNLYHDLKRLSNNLVSLMGQINDLTENMENILLKMDIITNKED